LARTVAEVEDWFAASAHPLKDVMREVRSLILAADERVEECVKWKTPTFTFKGNIASINPQAKQFVSLMFHRGAEIPGQFAGLQGGGEVARYMRFENVEDVRRQATELQAIVRAWCEMKAV
jgi:hypothetical protein